jgi:DMSO/TMAO reductase YedYZ heme-binding membrane subunit
MINFLAKIRDIADEILMPFVALIVRNRKAIRLIVLILVFLSFVLLVSGNLRFYGKSAWLLFLIVLFLGPIAQISRSKILNALMVFRREAGILMGVFAIEHSWLFFVKFGLGLNFILEKNFWLAENWITPFGFGMAALALTVPLMATSNNFSVRFLKGNWKTLHRLAYVILILIALHIVFVGRNSFQAFAIVIFYAAVKILAVSGFKIPETNTETTES